MTHHPTSGSTPVRHPAGEPLIRNIRSPKIQPRHLERQALVYVRQSTPHQMWEHPESLARQYELAHHAQVLGWSAQQVVVIDDDQGLSGRSTEQRLGFQRLLTEVALERVGLVLGLEMSRLARSSKDWHHLLELCAMFGTLLADQDGVYNPSDSNDRLLLGLKGTMSDFEAVTMRNRLQRGTLHKAERGELFIAAPFGYLKQPTGELALDPDEQVRETVKLIFDAFDEVGSVYGLMGYLVRNNIRLGVRSRNGPRRGEVEWRRPCRSTLFKLLHHPVYAGAYAFGRKRLPTPTNGPGEPCPRRTGRPEDEWKILLRDRVPAYISWDRFVANQERLCQNRSRLASPGVPRAGAALLAGILYCGTCGRRMSVKYRHPGQPYYRCERHLEQAVERTCHGLDAAGVDNLLADQVQRVLEPAALTLHLQVLEDHQRERERLESHWAKRLERARYECDRAERQHHAVEPENRLVARTLERKWEEALAARQQLQDEYDRFARSQPLQVSDEERQRLLALSRDIPTLWNAEGTSAEDRKEIIRCLVDRVAVSVQQPSERVTVAIHWQGGSVSQHATVRSVASFRQLADADRLRARVVELRTGGSSASRIAEQLNAGGFSSRRPGRPFTKHQVEHLLELHGLTTKRDVVRLGTGEWLIGKLASTLGVGREKLREWFGKGWVHGRQTPTSKLCIIWADADELKRLRRLRAHSKPGVSVHPPELITPKKRPNGSR